MLYCHKIEMVSLPVVLMITLIYTEQVISTNPLVTQSQYACYNSLQEDMTTPGRGKDIVKVARKSINYDDTLFTVVEIGFTGFPEQSSLTLTTSFKLFITYSNAQYIKSMQKKAICFTGVTRQTAT